jgi:hypothetical protein
MMWEFWTGWLKGPLLSASGLGFGALGMATWPYLTTLILFLAMLVAYFLALGNALMRIASRTVKAEDVFLGFLGVYGLSLLPYFVGRSHPLAVYPIIIPFGLIITLTAGRIHKKVEERLLFDKSRFLFKKMWGTVPYIMLGMAIIILAKNEPFQNYPNPLASMLGRILPRGPVQVFANPKDVSGLPEAKRAEVEQFARTVSQLANLNAAGKSIAILSLDNTIYYYAAGIPPWSEDPTILLNLLRWKDVERLKERLREHHPDYVVLEWPPDPTGLFTDVLPELRDTLATSYKLEGSMGPLEMWRYSGAAPAPRE